MSEEQDRSTGFYEAKGMVRRMVVFSAAHYDRLKALAKQGHITQGEVIEVALDALADNQMVDLMAEKRESKVDARSSIKTLTKRLKTATPEELAQIEAIINQNK